MPSFTPQLVLVQKAALDYPLGRELKERFEKQGIELVVYEKRTPFFRHKSFRDSYRIFKRTVVLLVWRQGSFQTCKPSAHYQLPLTSGCPGFCQYCYLNTNLGRRPYVKVYVNVEDILQRCLGYIEQRRPEITVFEGAATSDPVAVEGWTGSLRKAVEFFAPLADAKFRFVTKYTDVDGLLGVAHGGKTEVRFSLNCIYILDRFEKGVPGLRSRLEAAKKCFEAAYPVGFLIAPIFVFKGWREQYSALFREIKDYLPAKADVFFELITHRFTARSKKIILDAYPGTEVPLDEAERSFKHGQFGYGKYVYPPDVMAELKEFFVSEIARLFPGARILYFV